MKIQFDVPTGPATKLGIVIYDIKKEVKKVARPVLRAYMEAFHELRTGSKEDFE